MRETRDEKHDHYFQMSQPLAFNLSSHTAPAAHAQTAVSAASCHHVHMNAWLKASISPASKHTAHVSSDAVKGLVKSVMYYHRVKPRVFSFSHIIKVINHVIL